MTSAEGLELVGRYAAIGVTTFLAGGAGAYVGSYLKKKGENLATREDISALVAQVAAVTKTTKEIEAAISGDLWSRQKQWEIKKDALFELLRDLAVLERTAGDLKSMCALAVKERAENGPGPAGLERTHQAVVAFTDAHLAFERSRMLAFLVCGQNTINKIARLASVIGIFAMQAGELGRTAQDYNDEDLARETGELLRLLREELGVGASGTSMPHLP